MIQKDELDEDMMNRVCKHLEVAYADMEYQSPGIHFEVVLQALLDILIFVYDAFLAGCNIEDIELIVMREA
jgi:hypothetical protein